MTLTTPSLGVVCHPSVSTWSAHLPHFRSSASRVLYVTTRHWWHDHRL